MRRSRSVVPAVLGVAVLAVSGVALAVSGTAFGTASRPSGSGRPDGSEAVGRTLVGVRDVRKVAALTGPDSVNRTDRYQVAGQDLGSMFDAFGKTWFVFGDTFGHREPGQTGGGGTEWRSNALAWSTDRDPADGIRLGGYVTDEQGRAAELLGSPKVDNDEITVIPTYGFAVGKAMYLHYMSVRHWGDPGKWDANHAGLARSTDHGRTWTKLDSPRWPGDSGFVQVSVVQRRGVLYFWSVPAGRFGDVRLMKVRASQVEDAGAYRYFAGTTPAGRPRWSTELSRAEPVLEGTSGELSVVWNDYLGSWLMAYTDGESAGTKLSQAPTPWGPWRKPVDLLTQEDVPGLYAPYLKRGFTADHGRTVYFSLSEWGPYQVFWYRADLVAR